MKQTLEYTVDTDDFLALCFAWEYFKVTESFSRNLCQHHSLAGFGLPYTAWEQHQINDMNHYVRAKAICGLARFPAPVPLWTVDREIFHDLSIQEYRAAKFRFFAAAKIVADGVFFPAARKHGLSWVLSRGNPYGEMEATDGGEIRIAPRLKEFS